MNNYIEEKIKEALTEQGHLSSSKIASLIAWNYFETMKILKKMESENLIEIITVGKRKHWRIKNHEG